MDYQKAYKEAFAHAREIHRNEEEKRRDMEFIFPELKESEDERIRKELLNYLYDVHDDDEDRARWIAWLEKQGEQKSAWTEEDEKQARQIERIVHNDGCTQKLQKQIADWFKSIKERIQPQTKYEWSDDDEMILSDIIKDLVHPWNEYIPDRIEDEIKWLKRMVRRLV